MTPSFLIHEPPLQVSPTLAREIGLHEAVVLQQIHYWLNLEFSRCVIDGDYWVRYIPQHWERQFAFWDPKTLRRTIRNLKKRGLVIFCRSRNVEKDRYCGINYRILRKTITSSRSKRYSFLPAYDHANFDAIHDGEELGGNNE